jgi:hypothetical protein
MRASATRSRLSSAACLLGAALLLAPPPASARRDHWDDDDRPRRHHRGHGHHKHKHGEWCPPQHSHAPRYYEREDYGWAPGWYAPRPVAHARYRCEPCGHWYDDEASFHSHIHRAHHIAQAAIPLLIGAAAFGWIFYGH